MTPEQRQAAISEAIDHLDWFKIPHTLDQVIGVYAEATSELAGTTARSRTNDQMVDGIKASAAEGRNAKGGHSDPTPAAALAGFADAVDDDATIGSIDASLALLCGHVLELADALAVAEGREPYRAPVGTMNRQSRITDASTDLHRLAPHLAAFDLMDRAEANHLDYVIGAGIAETAEWLHVKAEAIWDASKGEARQVAEQKPITECRLCSPWRTGTIAVSRDRCEQCAVFQDHHKCKPTEAIVKRWAYAKGATPGQILEAQATSKRKVKAS